MTERIQHDLVQGTPEWMEFRLTHHGASEAAAMLGLSKKVKRSELMLAKHTGVAKEFSAWVQEKVLDHGHEVEALARPLVEKLIGEPLYPVTMSLGKLSASCDGLTLGDDVAFEHKQYSAELFASVSSGIVPDEHMPQCQQIMLVTGAEKVLFVCSDGTPDRFAMTEVLPDQAWFERLEAGWQQFDKDLADYTPPEPEQAVVAAPQATLPAVMVRVDGALTVTDNLNEFGQQLAVYVASLNFSPQTDQDFADLEAAVKVLKRAEEEIDEREAGAMAQIEAVNRLRQVAAAIREAARQPRLRGEKVVKSGKEDRKIALVTAATQAFAKHVAGLQAEITAVKFMPPAPSFGEAIKGLKTLSSIKDRLDTALANGKIAADAEAADVRAKLAWLDANAAEHRALLADLQQLVAKPFDDFKLAVTSRIEAQKKAEAEKLEAERMRIRAEEEAKARAEAEAKVRHEVEAEAARRKSAEEQARTEAEAMLRAEQQAAAPVVMQDVSTAILSGAPSASERESLAKKTNRDGLLNSLRLLADEMTDEELAQLVRFADTIVMVKG